MFMVQRLHGFGARSFSPISVSFVTSGDSNTDTIVVPAGAQAGDFAIMLDIGFASPTEVIPTGWTKFAGGLSNTVRMVFSYKILTQADVGATVTGMNATTDNKIMAIFRGDRPIYNVSFGGVGAGAANEEYTTGNPVSQTLTIAAFTEPMLLVSGHYGSNGVDLGEVVWTPNEDAIIGFAALTAYALYYRVVNSSPADTTIDQADEGTNLVASAYFRFT